MERQNSPPTVPLAADGIAAGVNRVSGATDVAVTGPDANRAVELRRAVGVSVVDATVAQAAEAAPKPVVIITLPIGA